MYKKTGLTIIFIGTYLVATPSRKNKRRKKKKTKNKTKKTRRTFRGKYIYIYKVPTVPKASNKLP